MTHKLFYLLILLTIISCQNHKVESVNYNVHTFYYNWYASPEVDGEYFHWNHDVLPHWSDTSWNNAGGFPGGNNIGANFYPALGSYSSSDSKIIHKHMELIRDAGIGVVTMSWWGKDSYEDKCVISYLNIAEEYGLKLIFHIEPCYKTVEEFREQLQYLSKTYSAHSAVYKFDGKPFYYIYDSYKLSSNEWASLLNDDGKLSIRNTSLDGTFIGLWVHENEGDYFIESGFDGFYTYFASDGFVYGSTSSNWQYLSYFAESNNLIFIPCVGPGYIDTRIRPWNSANTKDREKGKYYERMFRNAINVEPEFIGITSFNEWHEGTQIEPAVSKSIPSYTYEDYGKELDPLFYIRKTKELISEFESHYQD